MEKITHFFLSKKIPFLLFLLLIIHFFLRIHKIDVYNPFNWDQVDNAWAAEGIIVQHKFPLLGMVAKGNSGIYIGPAYYYLIAIFYFLFNLDPIASGVFAAVTSLLGFFSIYFVSKKIFSKQVAYIAVFINAVSYASIYFDRVQWPVDLIPGISLLIFYCLYKVITGNAKYIIWLAILIGFSFHVHFTSVFYPMFVFLSLPFFPWSWKTIKYILLSIPLFIVFLIPNIITELQTKNSHTNNLFSYGSTYYQGFHLRRLMQLLGDAFIQFETFLLFPSLRFLKFIFLPLMTVILFIKNKSKDTLLLIYLLWLWFIVPWFVFATYRGEISDYYFSVNRYIVILILAYCIYLFYSIKTFIPKVITVIALGTYACYCIYAYFSIIPIGMSNYKQQVRSTIQMGKKVQFFEGNPESYIYYIYTRGKNK